MIRPVKLLDPAPLNMFKIMSIKPIRSLHLTGISLHKKDIYLLPACQIVVEIVPASHNLCFPHPSPKQVLHRNKIRQIAIELTKTTYAFS